jgi:hypothetical protein
MELEARDCRELSRKCTGYCDDAGEYEPDCGGPPPREHVAEDSERAKQQKQWNGSSIDFKEADLHR